MFTNLIGFIKPLLKKTPTETKSIARTRPIGEDEPRTFKEYEDGFEVDDHGQTDNHTQNAGIEADDKLDLSMAALRHLVEQADASDLDKDAALKRIRALEARGETTLSIPVGTSVVSFLNRLD